MNVDDVYYYFDGRLCKKCQDADDDRNYYLRGMAELNQ